MSGQREPTVLPCIHDRVSAIYAPPGGRWTCDVCGQQFQPVTPPDVRSKAHSLNDCWCGDAASPRGLPMSEQRDGLSREERQALTAALASKNGCWDYEECCWASFEAMERALVPIVARREAAAAAEAVEKALGPVSELADSFDRQADELAPPDDWGDTVGATVTADSWRAYSRAIRAAIARGREEAGTVPQARGNGHESDEQTGAGTRGHRDATEPGERQQRNSGDEIRGNE